MANDGFGLGAQRRAVGGEELTQVKTELAAYLQALRSGQPTDELQPTCGLIILKEKIAANGDYNLSAERNRGKGKTSHKWPMVELRTVCEDIRTGPFGTLLHRSDYVDQGIPLVNPQDIVDGSIVTDKIKTVSSETRDRMRDFTLRERDIVIGRRGEMGRCAIVSAEMNGSLCGTGSCIIRLTAACDVHFVALQLRSQRVAAHLEQQSVGVTMKNLNHRILNALQIPLPPLEVQKEIVAEIAGYQKVINGARAVLDHYRPHIPIHPDWPMVELGEIIEDKPKNGYSGKPVARVTDVKVLTLSATTSGKLDLSKFKYLDEEIPQSAACRCRKGDIYLQRGKHRAGNYCLDSGTVQ